jgi:heptosyltransferase-2
MIGFPIALSVLRPSAAVPAGRPLPRGGNVAVVQPLPGIGDMIWHLPHIRAIAAAVGAPVTLVTKPGSAADQIFVAEPSVRRVLWLRRNQGVAGGLAAIAARWQFLSDLRAGRFDALVLLHHSRTLAATAALAGIAHRYGYGFGWQRLFLNRPPFLPVKALPWHPNSQATAWLTAAGIAAADAEPVLPVLPDVAAMVAARLGDGAPLVAIGIGSSEPVKQWGAERFAALIRLLRAGHVLRPILVGGAAEAGLAAEIFRLADDPALAAAIGWPLPEVAALLAACACYVGNDTGVANIAAAVGTRSFVLFGATPPLDHSRRIVPILPVGGVDRLHGMADIAPAAALRVIEADEHAMPRLRGGHPDGSGHRPGGPSSG